MGCGDPLLLDPEPSSPTACPVVWRAPGKGSVASVSSSRQGECGGDILVQEKEATSVAIFTGLVPLLRSVPTTVHPLPGICEVSECLPTIATAYKHGMQWASFGPSPPQ